MPRSDPENKDVVREWHRQIKPELTVDIGPGQGTYADLLRKDHKGFWIGLEAWAPYVNEFKLRKKYDRIIVSDVRHVDFATVHHGPDLVIAGDVIEHMAKEEVEVVLRKLQAWAKNVIVSIPLGHHPQSAYQGNWFETHQSEWTHEQVVEELGDGLVDYKTGNVLGYYRWSRRKAAGF